MAAPSSATKSAWHTARPDPRDDTDDDARPAEGVPEEDEAGHQAEQEPGAGPGAAGREGEQGHPDRGQHPDVVTRERRTQRHPGEQGEPQADHERHAATVTAAARRGMRARCGRAQTVTVRRRPRRWDGDGPGRRWDQHLAGGMPVGWLLSTRRYGPSQCPPVSGAGPVHGPFGEPGMVGGCARKPPKNPLPNNSPSLAADRPGEPPGHKLLRAHRLSTRRSPAQTRIRAGQRDIADDSESRSFADFFGDVGVSRHDTPHALPLGVSQPGKDVLARAGRRAPATARGP